MSFAVEVLGQLISAWVLSSEMGLMGKDGSLSSTLRIFIVVWGKFCAISATELMKYWLEATSICAGSYINLLFRFSCNWFLGLWPIPITFWICSQISCVLPFASLIIVMKKLALAFLISWIILFRNEVKLWLSLSNLDFNDLFSAESLCFIDWNMSVLSQGSALFCFFPLTLPLNSVNKLCNLVVNISLSASVLLPVSMLFQSVCCTALWKLAISFFF